MNSHKNFSSSFIGFLQAFGIFVYCSLVGFLMWTGNELFGPMADFLGPALVLSILVASVLICALLAFGYPIIIFREKKSTKEPLTIVLYTSAWLAFFVLFVIAVLALI